MGGFRKGKGKGRRPGGKGKGKGRRSGGKGKGKRLARPRDLGHTPTHSSTPSPLPEDPSAPFLHPAPRALVSVPLEFASLRQWCDVIGNNILAEFWQVYKEGRGVFSGFGGAAGDELIIDNAPADGLTQHLLLVDGQPRIASSQRILGVGKVAVKLRGGGARSGPVKSLGYIGSFLAEYSATIELRKLPPREMTGPMRAILEPKVDLPGDYAKRQLDVTSVPLNPSQRSAVESLRFALEKIQGPPGTGKSTTIFHILDSKLPAGERVLVTCSRNVAVESIAQKLEGLDDWPLCVFGPRDRVGETARRYLLDSQVGGHLDERRVGKVAPLVAKRAAELGAAIAAREAACRQRRGERFLLAFLRKRHAAAYGLRDLCDRLGIYCSATAVAPEWCRKQTLASKEQVLDRSRVFLCTIASTSRMLREWEEASDIDFRVHTVIVDECGCTPESSTALLLRLRPSNLVLVGDHKQLPPCSLVPPHLLEGTGHTRSLLERCVLASGQVHQLREQYRMHPSIGSLVSNLFYSGRLQTPQCVREARTRREKNPLVWLDVQGHEEAPERSYMNSTEVGATVRACARVREQVLVDATIAVLTFYRGQLDALMRAIPSTLGVEVLTVDACQGSEFDYVILSTVRANREQRLGFVKDPQRINVAISRARMQLIIVGHKATLQGDGDWRQVAAACSAASPHEFSPQNKLPSTFVSVFDMLRQQKDREAEQKAAAALEEAGNNRRGGSAETLMQRQTSFRSKSAQYQSNFSVRGPVRQSDGNYQSSSAAAVIGGGFRRRKDIVSTDAQLAHHQSTLDAATRQSLAQTAGVRYHAPKTTHDLEEQFPDLNAVSEATLMTTPTPKIPRATGSAKAGALRVATQNDKKRARRAAQRASSALEIGQEETATVQPDVLLEVNDNGWDDIHEAMLFEMFPNDTAAVEECLLRFAGMKHQAARALEALLARPQAQSKAAFEEEDDLDYDLAPVEDTEDAYVWADADIDAAHWEEDEEWEEAPGWCAACGEEAEDDVAEDGMQYCGICWAEWTSLAGGSAEAVPDLRPSQCISSVSASDGGCVGAPASAEREVLSRPDPPPLPKDTRPPPPPVPEQASRAVEGSVKLAPKPKKALGGRPTERVAFFDGLDGAPQWSEAPPRPEAGGKELVALQPKETRGHAAPKARGGRPQERNRLFDGIDGMPKWAETPAKPEAGGKELVSLVPKSERDKEFISPQGTGRRWQRDVKAPPAAAFIATSNENIESRGDRCRELLRVVEPRIEDDVIEYLASLVEDDVGDDTREAVLEILDGHGVQQSSAETFWQGLTVA